MILEKKNFICISVVNIQNIPNNNIELDHHLGSHSPQTMGRLHAHTEWPGKASLSLRLHLLSSSLPLYLSKLSIVIQIYVVKTAATRPSFFQTCCLCGSGWSCQFHTHTVECMHTDASRQFIRLSLSFSLFLSFWSSLLVSTRSSCGPLARWLIRPNYKLYFEFLISFSSSFLVRVGVVR